MVRRRLGIVVVAALALTLAACGVPTQSSPSSIARSRVPFGLLNRRAPSTTTTTPHQSFVLEHVFYLSSTNQLVSVQRVVYVPATLSSTLTALLAGPDSTESTSGLRTAIPDDVNVISAIPTAPGIVTVDFDAGFSEISGGNAELAVSQVVDTVATQNGLDTGVEFEIEGQRTSVPIASGATVPGPVYLLQFVNPPGG
ncbi:MAG TPA: GerMN domain-containing protein [Acidimicrobiales bacterium]|jgi:spore germination protein GerM